MAFQTYPMLYPIVVPDNVVEGRENEYACAMSHRILTSNGPGWVVPGTARLLPSGACSSDYLLTFEAYKQYDMPKDIYVREPEEQRPCEVLAADTLAHGDKATAEPVSRAKPSRK